MKEQISALMDGELEGRAAEQTVDALRGEGEALETWRLYHLISDGMRDTCLLRSGFTARFSERLAAEPTVLAPGGLPGRTPVQRFAFAAAASIAAVAMTTFSPSCAGRTPASTSWSAATSLRPTCAARASSSARPRR